MSMLNQHTKIHYHQIAATFILLNCCQKKKRWTERENNAVHNSIHECCESALFCTLFCYQFRNYYTLQCWIIDFLCGKINVFFTCSRANFLFKTRKKHTHTILVCEEKYHSHNSTHTIFMQHFCWLCQKNA